MISATWDPALNVALDQAAKRAQSEAEAGIAAIASAAVVRLQESIKGERFKASVTATVSGLTAEVGSTSPIAALLERGRRPGRRPPPQTLQRSMSLSAAAAARAADRIEKSGTKGRRYVEKMNRELLRDELPAITSAVAERIAKLDQGV